MAQPLTNAIHYLQSKLEVHLTRECNESGSVILHLNLIFRLLFIRNRLDHEILVSDWLITSNVT